MKHVISVKKGSDERFVVYPEPLIRLEGYSAWMQIRRTKNAEDVLDELTTENGRIKICCNHFILSFPHETTQKWVFRRGVFDIKVISPDGEQIRVAEGNILVLPGVTR